MESEAEQQINELKGYLGFWKIMDLGIGKRGEKGFGRVLGGGEG